MIYTEQDVKLICRTLLETVNYCHSRDVVHRDIKPENIIMTATGSLCTDFKLIDFGLSVISVDDKIQGRVGTPLYKAPEMWIKDKFYGKAVDLWAVGVIIYILLCGSPPFTADNKDALSSVIQQGIVKFDKPVWQRTSCVAKGFISSLLSKDVAHRPNAYQALNMPWVS